MSELKLGKKLGVVHDRRTFELGAFIRSGELPAVPADWRFARNLHDVPVFANDRYGDCTIASHGHRIVAQEFSTGQHEIKLSDEDVLEAYSAVTGFRPDDPSTDNGAYMLDVANYVRRVGLGHEKDGTRHTVEAFVKLRHGDHAEVAVACNLFGGIWFGAGLPRAAQWQEQWDAPRELTGDYEPGSWGGHAMYGIGFNRSGILAYTWGREKFLTWRFWDAYVDEAYAFIAEDWLRAGGKTHRGFDVAQLRGLLGELR